MADFCSLTVETLGRNHTTKGTFLSSPTSEPVPPSQEQLRLRDSKVGKPPPPPPAQLSSEGRDLPAQMEV